MSLFEDPTVGMVPEPTYSVGELADAIGHAVRSAFRDEVWVRGEIHDLSRPPSGHVYLTLVEERPEGGRATISVMLSAANKVAVNRALTRAGGGVRMVDGTEVRVRGRLDWYSPRGQLQLRMTAIDPAYTLGQLEVARAQLIARLDAEGLLRRNAVLELPLVPLRVGLITSRGSAAEADFLDELGASGLAFHVIAVDVRVQGNGAARHIASGIASAAARACDVIAVVRGGGARTDLASFDDEQVARAIARAPVPVITGIGHEIDRSVADEVAHTAAKTPTAAAQLLVEQVGAYLAQVEHLWALTARVSLRELAAHHDWVQAHAGRASRNVRTSLAGASQRLDRDLGRLTAGARVKVRDADAVLQATTRRLALRVPRSLAEAERAVLGAEARVRSLDPQRALARGWSITRTGDGRIVRDPSEVSPGDSLVTQLGGGEVRSTVDPDG